MKIQLTRVVLSACLLFAGTTEAADRVILTLMLTNNGFSPATLTAKPGQRLMIRMTNQTQRVAELESYDMKFEKIATPGNTITVFAGPLQSGKYKFFDDYSTTGVSGWLTVSGN
ncbi:cupredoxin domain-containing protein [Klebsiella indica]|uniref:Cupredoxin domain-containing protein n=1 Tax=Klebsiella indica TaxID=2582917 RepID=A0A5R9LFV6_9ENTR|nr:MULTISPECIES: cupredoxin domain-containing protein [Klebsiella]TLV15627.1 cupredoxin domain-containing protein [Klebsiella indica]